MDEAETESWIIDQLRKQGAVPIQAKEDSENVPPVIDEAFLLRAEERALLVGSNDDPWTAQLVEELVAEIRRLHIVELELQANNSMLHRTIDDLAVSDGLY